MMERYCTNCKEFTEFKGIWVENKISIKREDNVIHIEHPTQKYSCDELECGICGYKEQITYP